MANCAPVAIIIGGIILENIACVCFFLSFLDVYVLSFAPFTPSYFRRTGNKRPTSGPFFGKRSRDRNAERHKRKPPRGMYINHDDIVALASANDNQDELLANIDREIVSLLSQVRIVICNIICIHYFYYYYYSFNVLCFCMLCFVFIIMYVVMVVFDASAIYLLHSKCTNENI